MAWIGMGVKQSKLEVVKEQLDFFTENLYTITPLS